MPGLTDKQRVFVEHYLTCWNATEAARQAQYTHPNKQGPALLVNLGIQAAIQARLAELKMSADEVLIRLADQARGTMADFLDDAGAIDLTQARERGKLHLLKTRSVTKEGERIELYSSYDALVQIGKTLGLFVDRQALEGETTIRIVRDDYDDSGDPSSETAPAPESDPS